MKRRRFLAQTLIGAASLTAVGKNGWAWKSPAAAAVDTPRLIVILLRGAADGLNIVVPYQEANYYESRPYIAIAQPGKPDGALDLDGQFGLHPALQPLMAQWENGNLAFVHATGLPDTTRSHFQAQEYLETGTLEADTVPNGWLNRLLGVLPQGTSTQGLNIGATMPAIFSGSQSVASIEFGKAGSRQLPIDRPQIQIAFDQLYANDARLGQIYQEGRTARDTLMRELSQERIEASQGAATPSQFESSARYLAQLMKGEAATQVAFLDIGGWDTHVNQRGVFNKQLESLGKGLSTLAEALGPVYQHTAIVVTSEFGRTVAENGNSGSDHGYGNALWLLGGSLKGQQMYGTWPGLSEEQQHKSRDLAITTDTRDVLMSLLSQHFSLNANALAQVFPNHQQKSKLQLLIS